MQKKSQRVAKTRAGAGQDAQEGRQGGRHPHAAVVTAVSAPGLLPHIYIYGYVKKYIHPVLIYKAAEGVRGAAALPTYICIVRFANMMARHIIDLID